ncbi:MAG: sulfur carrier protein ThiS [Sandaracinaceae bacterium]|nr:sulfur carrier protein ThiS [Sandaracinaceae bacterium]
MRLIVNGQERSFQSPIDVRGLLDALGLGDTLVAVERNREIVPRAEYASTPLEENDEIEIVHFVGGG